MPNQKQALFLFGLWVISYFTWVCGVEMKRKKNTWGRQAGIMGWAWASEELRDRKTTTTTTTRKSSGSSALYSTTSFCEQSSLELCNSVIRGFPSMVFSILFMKNQWKHTYMVRVPNSCPFFSLLSLTWGKEILNWGVHIRFDIRESEKKTQVRKQSNPTLSSKPLVYSHHYKLTFWEVHLFQLLSNNVRVPLSDNLKAQTWLGSQMAIIGAGMWKKDMLVSMRETNNRKM